MDETVKPEQQFRTRPFPTRWTEEEFDLIERAAAAKAAVDHMECTPTDVIRSGALRRAEEILGAAAQRGVEEGGTT